MLAVSHTPKGVKKCLFLIGNPKIFSGYSEKLMSLLFNSYVPVDSRTFRKENQNRLSPSTAEIGSLMKAGVDLTILTS